MLKTLCNSKVANEVSFCDIWLEFVIGIFIIGKVTLLWLWMILTPKWTSLHLDSDHLWIFGKLEGRDPNGLLPLDPRRAGTFSHRNTRSHLEASERQNVVTTVLQSFWKHTHPKERACFVLKHMDLCSSTSNLSGLLPCHLGNSAKVQTTVRRCYPAWLAAWSALSAPHSCFTWHPARAGSSFPCVIKMFFVSDNDD